MKAGWRASERVTRASGLRVVSGAFLHGVEVVCAVLDGRDGGVVEDCFGGSAEVVGAHVSESRRSGACDDDAVHGAGSGDAAAQWLTRLRWRPVVGRPRSVLSGLYLDRSQVYSLCSCSTLDGSASFLFLGFEERSDRGGRFVEAKVLESGGAVKGERSESRSDATAVSGRRTLDGFVGRKQGRPLAG
jgi:hypothetical protein